MIRVGLAPIEWTTDWPWVSDYCLGVAIQACCHLIEESWRSSIRKPRPIE